MARQAKKRPPPYNASGQGCPPEPCVVDDTEDLPDQGIWEHHALFLHLHAGRSFRQAPLWQPDT